jgi:hypothetical protein
MQDMNLNDLGFVDVYLDEIIKYDIQLTTISVGTGTKGKVLDALANGLMVMGLLMQWKILPWKMVSRVSFMRRQEQLISVSK